MIKNLHLLFYNTKNKTKSESGFSLVELIVVIAIIIVLVSIMIPKVLGYIQKANNLADCNNAKTLANMVLMSMAAGEVVDYSNVWYGGNTNTSSNDYQENYNHLYIYVDDNEIRCSSREIADLLIREKIATGNYTMRRGTEPEFSFAANNTRFACQSKEPWDRYQINFYDRDGTIWYTFSASNKKTFNNSTRIDKPLSKEFADLCGGPVDEVQKLGQYD